MYAMHLAPPVLPTIPPMMTVGQGAATPPAGFSADGAASGIEKSHQTWTDKTAGALTGAALGAGLGLLGGAIGGGVGTYHLLPRELGTGWKTGLAIASAVLLTGPIGGYLGLVIGATLGK